jgi:hypothetical protein
VVSFFWLSHRNLICIPLSPVRTTYPAYHILLNWIILIIESQNICIQLHDE